MSGLYPRLWRYCRFLTGRRDLADDLAQAACLRALERHDSYVAGTHLDRWLFRIAQRIWFNEKRADAVRRGAGLVDVDSVSLADETPHPDVNILARQVLKEVEALPEAQRVTVALVYVEGFAYREAAEILEIPIGTVMSRLAAARKTIGSRIAMERTGS